MQVRDTIEVRIECAYRSLEAAYYHVQELKRKGWLTSKRRRFLARAQSATGASRPSTPGQTLEPILIAGIYLGTARRRSKRSGGGRDRHLYLSRCRASDLRSPGS